MSRAINVNAPQADVVKLCGKHNAAISAIESLPSGGTRVVFNNIDATETMARIFGKKVLTGTVTRTPLTTRWR
jgi:hypothetical protein